MKVIYGRAGSGKSEFIFNNIKNNKDAQVYIITPEQFSFSAEKRLVESLGNDAVLKYEVISFIISANNNIPRIKGIIDRLSEKYGEKLEYDGSEYYSFPEPIALKDVSVSEYRSLGLGFRDIRLYETTQKILNNEFDLNGQWNLDTGTVYKNLLELSGVGPKVADCILLFSDLKRFDVFPIDVWIRRVMNDLYIHNDDETKVSKVQIQKLADEKFGSLKGLAQQYLFYWRRSL